MNLISSDVFRLYCVSTNLNENGEYPLEPLNNDALNQDIDEDDLDEALDELADTSYGQEGGRLFEVTHVCYDENGKICAELGDDECLEIQDITDKIATDSEHSRFFILCDAQLSDYLWVVAEPQ